MTVDVAGSGDRPVVTDHRIHYAPRSDAAIAYRAQLPLRGHVVTRHVGSEIAVRDLVSWVEGSGPTYLDALRAFQQKRGA